MWVVNTDSNPYKGMANSLKYCINSQKPYIIISLTLGYAFYPQRFLNHIISHNILIIHLFIIFIYVLDLWINGFDKSARLFLFSLLWE